MTNFANSLRSTFTTLTLLMALTANACSSSSAAPTCDAVVAHTAKLLKMEFEGEAKQKAIAKCEKTPANVRACALKAEDLQQLAACK